MSIPVNQIVNVTLQATPIFPARKGYGILLLLGTSNILPVGERSRLYSVSDIDSVAADFGTNTPEYKAALIAASQTPKLDYIRIGRRFTSAVSAELLGTTAYTATIGTWNAITTGSLRLTMDGTVRTLSALDFTTDANLNAVAARIQAALIVAGATGAQVVFTGKRFVIRSGTTGTTSTITQTIASGTGTHIGGLLGTDAGSASSGKAAETVQAALQAQADYDSSWYGVHFATGTATTDQDILDAASWTEARSKIFFATTSSAAVIDPTSTSDVGSQLKALAYRRTFLQYDDNDLYAAVSAASNEFAVNFNEQNSTQTIKFKPEPGITPISSLTTNQAATLKAKNVNYYTYFGDNAIIAEGTMSNGVFLDEVHGVDWQLNAIQTNVYGTLLINKKIAQTDKGVAKLVQAASQACQDGVNNGLLAPGIWNGSEFGSLKTGDNLKTGYYIYAQPVSQQNLSDRQARIAPPIQIALKGAGAIHFVNISVSFDR